MRGKRQEGERDGGEKEQQLEGRDGSGRRGGGGLTYFETEPRALEKRQRGETIVFDKEK